MNMLAKKLHLYAHESLYIILNRAVYSFLIRLRGLAFKFFGVFSLDKDAKICMAIGYNCTLKHARLIRVGGNLKIGNNCRIECFAATNDCTFKLELGDNVSLGNNVHIGAANHIRIGDGVLLGSNILIIDHNHGKPSLDIHNKVSRPPKTRPLYSKGTVIIERNVWICDSAIILGGSHIGENSIISAGSIVRSNIPPNTIYKN
jgi:acetyltransferase-like isoleucine patch superfamily enzyme